MHILIHREIYLKTARFQLFWPGPMRSYGLSTYHGHITRWYSQNSSYSDSTSARLCIHERHPKARLHRRAMGYLSWNIQKNMTAIYRERTVFTIARTEWKRCYRSSENEDCNTHDRKKGPRHRRYQVIALDQWRLRLCKTNNCIYTKHAWLKYFTYKQDDGSHKTESIRMTTININKMG